MRTEWLQTLDEYYDEEDTPYSYFSSSGLSGCFNISTRFLLVKLLEVPISCGSHNNTY